ncbi:hypothetical protein EDM53_05475 [Rickettsiales endosymbiont of Peranema trichophorum]|uniref:hypothetical protein n=1 Tax=Rickettsiales endosymbiont of Peranema trichophorum TaxID=2486577 RepID=UPI0010F0C419|nr:hypothetical protein [Rickettsiales endosymbiont of Peranema trichophorum]RZI45291.1 hypothetical protein EDM53_05475 [Rickettsiales endosymbiont of Peranema trichophorum]
MDKGHAMITVQEVRQKIIDWRDGVMTTEEIQGWGEEKYTSNDLRNASLSEREHFIVIEVLQYLEFINMNLVTKDDIPHILEFIDGADHNDAYKKWNEYLNNIDYKSRADLLKGEAFYEDYCLAHLDCNDQQTKGAGPANYGVVEKRR